MSPQRKPKAKPQPAVEPAVLTPKLEPPARKARPPGQSRPTEMPAAGLAVGRFMGDTMPTEMPPVEVLPPRAAGAWVSDKKVEGVWSINEDRNGWAYISDVGWKQLANTSVAAFTVLNLLAAHALQTQGRVDFRDEADGMIHEMYIW